MRPDGLSLGLDRGSKCEEKIPDATFDSESDSGPLTRVNLLQLELHRWRKKAVVSFLKLSLVSLSLLDLMACQKSPG